MGDTERPVPDRPEDQTEQAQHLAATGNGPTVTDEEQLLAAQYGPPDMAGYYTGTGQADTAAAEPDENDDQEQPPTQAPASAEGSESA
ncbi:hypothetical protein [Streptomyces sp. NRRL F-5135]|uniref:hypothetical protein n=1 Tax=Streptomyces sp. NRRL F-5135 TaxID=1463858 RepID=UPI00055AA2B4|nr:hypothetical protein [Streptomyces sp. NRRL F-5135]